MHTDSGDFWVMATEFIGFIVLERLSVVAQLLNIIFISLGSAGLDGNWASTNVQ